MIKRDHPLKSSGVQARWFDAELNVERARGDAIGIIEEVLLDELPHVSRKFRKLVKVGLKSRGPWPHRLRARA